MSDVHGRFIWYELITPDTAAAAKFYGDLVGWTAQPMQPPPGAPPYTVFNNESDGQAGMMPLVDEMKAMGIPPCWTGYIGVDDVDAAIEKLKRLGGAHQRGPMDVPGVGRFAIVSDPAGATFAMMTPAPPQGGPPPPDIDAVGQTGWHELYSGDPEQTFAFYEEMFGWTKGDAVPMGGDMGVYQLFNNQDGQVGGMMKRPPQFPAEAWLYYFRVADIDRAADTAKAAGAQIFVGPMQVPNGEWVIQGADPQGATFAAVAKKG